MRRRAHRLACRSYVRGFFTNDEVSKRLSEKAALVTGGSRGIGAAIAKRLSTGPIASSLASLWPPHKNPDTPIEPVRGYRYTFLRLRLRRPVPGDLHGHKRRQLRGTRNADHAQRRETPPVEYLRRQQPVPAPNCRNHHPRRRSLRHNHKLLLQPEPPPPLDPPQHVALTIRHRCCATPSSASEPACRTKSHLPTRRPSPDAYVYHDGASFAPIEPLVPNRGPLQPSPADVV
jgi:hypothetical protein